MQGPEEIKKEIIQNGPVIAPMTPFTDFLTYKEGTYFPSEGSFKFNGQLIVKIIGWEQTMNGEVWIIENTWGPAWGNHGYATVMAGHKDLGLDFIGIAPRPIPMKNGEWEVESERLQEEYKKYEEAQAKTAMPEDVVIEDEETE